MLEDESIHFRLPELIPVLLKDPSQRSYEDIINVRTNILKAAFFRNLSERLSHTQLDSICRKLQYQTFERGQVIFSQGDIGDMFYLCLSGECEIRVKSPKDADGNYDAYEEKTLYLCQSGMHFGERALESNDRRGATVIATTFVETITIDKKTYTTSIKGMGKDIANGDFSAKAFTFRVLSKKRESRTIEELQSVARYLDKRVAYLRKFDREKQIALCRVAELTHVLPSATLFKQGSVGLAFYIILAGTVTVMVNPPATDSEGDEEPKLLVVNTLQPGEAFGERGAVFFYAVFFYKNMALVHAISS